MSEAVGEMDEQSVLEKCFRSEFFYACCSANLHGGLGRRYTFLINYFQVPNVPIKDYIQRFISMQFKSWYRKPAVVVGRRLKYDELYEYFTNGELVQECPVSNRLIMKAELLI